MTAEEQKSTQDTAERKDEANAVFDEWMRASAVAAESDFSMGISPEQMIARDFVLTAIQGHRRSAGNKSVSTYDTERKLDPGLVLLLLHESLQDMRQTDAS